MADHRARSRSPPPARDGSSRRRSRSPRRRDDDRDRRDRPRRAGGGGFRWKEKRKDPNEERGGSEKRLERGYRKRSPSPRRDRDRTQGSNGASVEDKFGVADKFGASASKTDRKENTDKPPERPAAQPASVSRSEPMIVVHVNDRLGTKAAIPCLASDTIKLFKHQVAAMIGRQPHEILLKRQGERPFKDQLTLEDYGISNGVQIDLEIDTGE
ncbi:hypothetical protein M430DRAFT_33066 [Amorphotheca resinae ATCC 22711]|uniref:Ubiquitin-like modifier HUB1 n=1 Tax=Amorphotheca resinae ATCC 22711 TaxID=857342 RepID=A0A2T3BAF3_AMORE|nr:hypothetical protein M430DRAFT_33066 [Amorphotheca resinae ATCC 22711]PSS25305.1 hypothetical protein M430DRAFT_33066 [Amorphotheca resinae ATCC 22711]